MGLTMPPSGSDTYRSGTSYSPDNGRWEPKKFQEQQVADRAQREKAAKDRKNLQIVMWVIGIVTFLSLIIPMMLPGNTGCDPCFLTTFIAFLFIGILLWVIYASGNVGQAAQANLPYFYPVVVVRGSTIYLDNMPVDYSTVALCQWDQVMDEFRIVQNDWKRRIIYLRFYDNTENLARAMKRIFEANGIRVEMRTAESMGTYSERKQALEQPYGAPPQEVPKATAVEEPVWAVEPVSEDEAYQEKVERTVAEMAPEAPRPTKEPVSEPQPKYEPVEEPEIEPEPAPIVIPAQPPDTTPRCRNCGAPLSEDLIECPKCGTAI